MPIVAAQIHKLAICFVIVTLLTPWSRVLLEKLTGFAASQENPRIYGTRKFITVLKVPATFTNCKKFEGMSL
jgi:hypothetical protein